MKKLNLLIYILKKSGFSSDDIIELIYYGATAKIKKIKNLRLEVIKSDNLELIEELDKLTKLDKEAELYRDILDYIIALYE